LENIKKKLKTKEIIIIDTRKKTKTKKNVRKSTTAIIGLNNVMHVLQFGMDAGKAVWFEAC